MVAARAGLDVLLLDKAPAFPRPKACGDALTPRAVSALKTLEVTPQPSWHQARGMAVYGQRDAPYHFDWPFGVAFTAPRTEFDALMLQRAAAAGAAVHLGVPVTAPLLEGGRVVGVTDARGGTWRAPVVVDATGASSRLGAAAGMPVLASRPLGVAVRGYMTGELPAEEEPWLHSWLALRGGDGQRLAGYGWVFPLGKGRYNVGVGQLSTSPSFRRTDYRSLLRTWAASLPVAWGLRWDGDIAGAALPMGINRRVLYRRGVLMVGDAAGLVGPFDGEGVSYALESGAWAGEAVVRAAAAGFGTPAGEAALQGYHHQVKAQFGGYFRAGEIFTHLMGNPAVLEFCLRHGLPRPWVMRPVNKLMSNLIAPSGGPLDDRALRALVQLLRHTG